MKFDRQGFSLIEVLAAMTVMTCVAGLGFVGWQRALQSSRQTACIANLRAIGTAAAMYSAETDGFLPGTSHGASSWIGSLQPYLGMRKPYYCPAATRKTTPSYALNDCLTPQWKTDFSRRQNISSPARTVFMTEKSDRQRAGDHFHFVDEETGRVSVSGALEQVPETRHPGGVNFLFVDGHVESLDRAALQARLTEPNTPFLNPAP